MRSMLDTDKMTIEIRDADGECYLESTFVQSYRGGIERLKDRIDMVLDELLNDGTIEEE